MENVVQPAEESPYKYKFNIVKYNKLWISVSVITLILSCVCFAVKGINLGIDFKGGTAIYIKFHKETPPNEFREVLQSVGLGRAVVQRFGEEKENMVIVYAESITLNSDQLKVSIGERLKGKAAVASLRMVGDEKAYVTLDKLLSPEELGSLFQGFSFEGHPVTSVSLFGPETNREYLVLIKGISSILLEGLNAKFGQGNSEILQVAYVGPKAGRQLQLAAVGAVLVALLLIFMYIFLRFDLKFAPGGVLCLFHDVIITTGVFSFLGLEFDLTIVAALLTLVGYSINDTIVVYDRIRENMHKYKGIELKDLINPSVNQTLSRTIITSLTVLMVTIVLVIFGGPVIFGFAFALTFGVIVGTYSSIYVASPITVWIDRHFYQKKA